MSYKWGLKPLSDTARLVEGRLKEVSGVERRASDKDGNFNPARLRVLSYDNDGRLRSDLGNALQKNYLNRHGRYDVLSYAGRKADLTERPIIQGRFVNVQPELGRRGVFELQDIIGAQFGPLDPDKTIGVPIGDEWPSRPESTKDKIYTILLGIKTDAALEDPQGILPTYECGTNIDEGVNPDPAGRTFNTAFAPVVDQANVNLIPGGDITYTTYSCVSRIVGTQMGPPSLTIVLDPYGNGAGGPSDAHTHKHVWMGNGAADQYIVWFFTDPGFHPIDNPGGDANARYKIISGTPTNPSWPPNTPTWEFECDFTTRNDGDVWGAGFVPSSTKTWFAVGLNEWADFDVWGPDLTDPEVTDRRRLYDVDTDGITTPDSAAWPHAERYRVVGGIRQSGFYVDPGPALDAVRAGTNKFAVNGCGLMGSNGLVIDQAFIQLLYLLNEIVELNDGQGYRDGDSPHPIELFPDGTPKFWTQKFLDAQQLTITRMGTTKGRIGQIVVTERTNLREVLRRFFVSHGGHITSDTHGRIYPFLIDPSLATGGPIYRERMEIKRMVGHWYAYNETENRIRFRWFYDYTNNTWRKPQGQRQHDQSITDHGGENIGVIETGVKECFYCDDEPSLIDKFTLDLQLYAYPPRYASWATDMAAIEVHNGDRLRFTNKKEGIGSGGDIETRGFQMGSTISIQPYEVIQTARLLDPTIAVGVGSAAGSSYGTAFAPTTGAAGAASGTGAASAVGAIKDGGAGSAAGLGAAAAVGTTV